MPKTLSDLEECFEDLLEVKAECSPGGKEFIFISGKKHEAIVEEISSSEIIISGGLTEGEQFRVKCRRREFTSIPEKGDTAKVRGLELEIVGPAVDRNGVELELSIGSLTGNER